MTDEILIRLRDALIGTYGMTEADLAADVREILNRMNLLVLPGPQPTETAPRDGTLVDLWVGGRRLIDMHWHEPMNTFKPKGWMDRDGYLDADLAPDCWMPAPPAPPRVGR